jgi:hypothetical protein
VRLPASGIPPEEIDMNRIACIALAASAAVAFAAPASAGRTCLEFEELALALEQNATDGDAEVVLFAKGGDEGLRRLTVTAPGGRKVARIEGDKRGVGLREFLLESAEPPDLPAVLASFPEGTYTFLARTVGGDCLRGEAALSHTLAPATTLLSPEQDESVPIDELVLSWSAVPEAVAYVVELNNEDTGEEMTFLVHPPAVSIPIPAGALAPDAEYQFGVGVQTASGNLTVVELTFTTAPAAP